MNNGMLQTVRVSRTKRPTCRGGPRNSVSVTCFIFFFVEASGCMGFEPLAQRKSAGHAYVGESL